LVASASVTLPVNVVAVFPNVSRAVTTTLNPAPAAVLAGGWVVKASALGGPDVAVAPNDVVALGTPATARRRSATPRRRRGPGDLGLPSGIRHRARRAQRPATRRDGEIDRHALHPEVVRCGHLRDQRLRQLLPDRALCPPPENDGDRRGQRLYDQRLREVRRRQQLRRDLHRPRLGWASTFPTDGSGIRAAVLSLVR